MAKHKTLAEKRRIQHRRENSPILSGYRYQSGMPADPVEHTSDDELLVVEPKYIKTDLVRTLILSLLFFGILIGLYMWTKSGNSISFPK